MNTTNPNPATPTAEPTPGRPASITSTRALRERQGLTMVQVAASARVSLNTLRRMEHAADQTTVDRFPLGFWRRVASVLGVSIGELLVPWPQERSEWFKPDTYGGDDPSLADGEE